MNNRIKSGKFIMSELKRIYSKFLRALILLLIFCLILPGCSKAQKEPESGGKIQINKSDPWKLNEVITPENLSAELKNKNKPLIIQVGFKILYDQNHIPGAVYTGPAYLEAGINALKDTLKNVNRDKSIVLYCGCCKWKDCPNIRPAFETVTGLGFKNVKVLYLEDTFVKNWIDKGYPTVK